MKPWITSLTILAILLLPSEGSKAECSIKAVEEGQTTKLTCTFGENVENKTLKIHHARKDGETPVTVLICPRGNQTNEPCTLRPTHSLHHVDPYTIIILMHNVTESHVGIYKCEALSKGDKNSSLSCNFTLVLSKQCENRMDCQNHSAIYIVAYCFIALTALILITFLIGYFVRRYLKKKKMQGCPKLLECMASRSQRSRKSRGKVKENEVRDIGPSSSSFGAGSTSTHPERSILLQQPSEDIAMTEMSSKQYSGEQRSNREETAFNQNTHISIEDAE